MDLVVAFTCGFLTLQAQAGRLEKLLVMMTRRSPFPCFQGKDTPESIVKKLRCVRLKIFQTTKYIYYFLSRMPLSLWSTKAGFIRTGGFGGCNK